MGSRLFQIGGFDLDSPSLGWLLRCRTMPPRHRGIRRIGAPLVTDEVSRAKSSLSLWTE